jgi:hypothetical protein
VTGEDRVTGGRGVLVERLATFPDRLRAAASAAEGREVPPGEWTAGEIVRHLIAVESGVWQARLDAVRDEPEPHWDWVAPRFDADPASRPLEILLATFALRRTETVARLRALDDAGWARSGVHAVYGRLDVAGLARVAIDHDEEHLASLAGS